MSTTSIYFDRLAKHYDETWTDSPAGRAQRNAVWRAIDPFVRGGACILDYGCGTGEDVLHFTQLGARVDAVDASPEMVAVALKRGIVAQALPPARPAPYDLLLSNFGALNCVDDIVALKLQTLVRLGGLLAICVMGRFCLWETAHYLLRGQFVKAKRRWRGQSETSTGMRVFYPSPDQVERALPGCRLIQDVGIGITVPPSFVNVPPKLVRVLEGIDRRLARAGRAIGDHRLLLFVRSK